MVVLESYDIIVKECESGANEFALVTDSGAGSPPYSARFEELDMVISSSTGRVILQKMQKDIVASIGEGCKFYVINNALDSVDLVSIDLSSDNASSPPV